MIFVIGISGLTGAGKTTVATRLHQYLSDPKNADVFDGVHINKVLLIHQDKYFYARDSPHHKWIPEINFINREVLSALDMDKFAADVCTTVQNLKVADEFNDISTISESIKEERKQINILIIEGFLIFNDERINQHCQLRIHLYLSYNVGLERRLKRNFKHINPKPEWYYEHYIWPMYHRYLNEVPNKNNLICLNGELSFDEVFSQTYDSFAEFLRK
ncbi:nicotinamide riboside kinase 1-like [Contarinia nasturtii]|uniref:nicotinamide riboside kinase 1-like n=1 Tax=Contarinia nasturtii TaxID=265458 RepID=UPI0012D3B8D1|nr:nicotinamide riboside kinase 1-like [Contarinia nasturtii]